MDFVIRHAMNTVWAEHIQDKDYYIKPARTTPNGGSLKYVELGLKNIALPYSDISGSSSYFHVYHIGQIPPHLLGIDIVENKWTTVDEIASKTECYVNIFLDNGYVVPRSKCFLMRAWPGRNILLAIENDPKMNFGTYRVYDPITNASSIHPNTLNNQQINVRFYTNARHQATDMIAVAKNPLDQMYFETSNYTRNVLDRIKANHHLDRLSQGWFVLNGNIMDYDAVVNSFREMEDREISIYRDETVIGIEYHRVQDLKTFTSEKTRNIRKYIVDLKVSPHDLVYFNDVEYYLGRKGVNGFVGLCIPMIRKDAITTITNKTHAIRTDIITDLMNANNWMTNSQDIYLMVVIRQGGMLRGLNHQATRIEELFKLPDTVVSSAMSGVNALLNEWKAVELENDDYAKIIAAEGGAIIPDMVYDAYGYNAITRYHHPNPLVVNDYPEPDWYAIQLSNVASERNKLLSPGGRHIEILEYNEFGEYLNRRRVSYSNSGLLVGKHPPNGKVGMIEHYVNSIEDNSLNLGEDFATSIANNDMEIFGFAAYVTTSSINDPNPLWIDVTKLNSYYYLTFKNEDNGTRTRQLVWNESNLRDLGLRQMVRINNRVCFKSFRVKDLISNDTTFPVITIPRNSQNKTQVEPGSIEIWLENKLLIEDIDYVVKWPKIYIGRRIIDVDTAMLHVRLAGLADSHTVKHVKPREVGFVKEGRLSVNSNYDTRSDRNIQICVGGVLRHRDDVRFDEDDKGELFEDGRPYQIRDYITPIELYTTRKTAIEKEKSMEIDDMVERYMNEYLPQPNDNVGTILGTRWIVVSVFLDKLIGLLLNGFLANEIERPFNATDVARWIEPYLYLYDVDVAYMDNSNPNYIRFIPHGRKDVVNLSLNQFKFIDMVVKTYLNNKVQINNLVNVVPGE